MSDIVRLNEYARHLGLSLPDEWIGLDAAWPLVDTVRAWGDVFILKLDGGRTEPDDTPQCMVLVSGIEEGEPWHLRADASTVEEAVTKVLCEYFEMKVGDQIYEDGLNDEISSLMYKEALALFEEERVSDALTRFIKSSQVQEHFKTYHRIAKCYEELGDFESAHDAITKSYDLNQNNSQTALEYAKSLFRQGDSVLAKQVVERILSRQPCYKKAREFLQSITSTQREDT